MSSFLGDLLGSEGCNPDGSIGQNPFTALVEKSFEYLHQNDPNQESFHSMGEHVHHQDESFRLMNNEPQPHQMMQNFHQHRSFFSNSYQAPQHMPFHPFPMYQQQPYLYQQPIYHPQSIQEHEQFQEQYLEQEPEEQYAEISEEERYLETIYQANKDLNKINWTIIDDETQPTKEGYQTAWNELEKKLESGELSEPKVYQYETTNPYLLEGEEVDIDSLIAEATELYEKGLVSEAILKFEAIVQHEKGKENAEVWRLLGVCHTENDNDNNAITALERSMDLDPYNLNTLLSLGTCYVNELDSVKALETLRTWVANNPKFVGLEVPQDEYSDGTLMDEVIQLMLAVAKHSPDDLDVQILLGVLFNISLDYGQAIECFDRVLDTMHTDYSVLNKMGATLANSNRAQMALPYYAKALEIRPRYARGWRNVGIAYANTNQYEEAAKSYLQALHLSPHAKHIWSYLRVVLSCMERMDLVQLSANEKIEELAQALNLQLLS